ncbi:MAG: AbrB family transcriptional regulator [Oscillospiraceae bacterium]|nr:AbrB family transcriptional regulator [Oscillospiraceae bacterium]
MDILFSIILTLAAAALGSVVFTKLKVPAGPLLGTMIFVSALNAVTGNVFFHDAARPVIRILAGTMVGAKMTKKDVTSLYTILFPAVLLVFGMLMLNLALGFGIHRLTGLNLMTALLGSAPGGIQDMALIADDIGADTAKITVLQTVRVLMVIGVMPTLLRAFSKKYGRITPPAHDPSEKASSAEPAGADIYSGARQKTLAFLRTLVIAAPCGFLVEMTGMPAGAMVGAMIGTVLSTLFIKPSYIPSRLRLLVQISAGIMIGSGIGAKELSGLGAIIVPSAILVVVLLVSNFAFGILIHKLTKLDLVTCLFASSAGGVMDMALIADELGADSPKVTLLQLARLICVIMLFPSIIMFFNAAVQ